MSSTTRLISTITLLIAVVLAIVALFVLQNKNLARAVFVIVLVVGYSIVFYRWRQHL